jgi:hypothetical protein
MSILISSPCVQDHSDVTVSMNFATTFTASQDKLYQSRGCLLRGITSVSFALICLRSHFGPLNTIGSSTTRF